LKISLNPSSQNNGRDLSDIAVVARDGEE